MTMVCPLAWANGDGFSLRGGGWIGRCSTFVFHAQCVWEAWSGKMDEAQLYCTI